MPVVPWLRLGECWPGFYCDWGSSRPDQSLCPAGFFCPRGTPSALACPAGTFSATPGITHQDNCTVCPAAYYCLGRRNVYGGVLFYLLEFINSAM